MVAGCGSDGGNDPDTGDGLPPSVHVAFPPPSSLTDTSTITVRGSVSDQDGVAAVRVNGADAQLLEGGTAWEATVSLEHGDNVLVVESEDSFGARDEMAAQLTVALSANWMLTPRAVVADVDNERALVLDRILDAVLAVDLATGERTVLSGDEVGDGPKMSEPIALALDGENSRILVLDSSLDALLSVDTDTGDRAVIADAATGDGPVLVGPTAMDVDLANNQALVLDIDRSTPEAPVPTLYGVDLDTGTRTVIADAETGDGPVLVAPVAMTADAEGGRALVLDVDATVPGERKVILYAVDLETGTRTVLSDETAAGSQIIDPVAVALDASAGPDQARALVLDESLDAVLAVDLDTGERSIVSADDSNSDEPQLSVPVAMGIEVRDQESRLLVLDSGLDALLAVDLDTGARSMVSDVAIGAGPEMRDPAGVMLDARSGDAGRALVLDLQQAACIAVDIATSERVVVADDEIGSGPELDEPVSVSLDVPVGPAGQAMAASRVLVADAQLGALLQVNVGTGARSVLSDGQTGSGPALQAPRAVTIQPGDEEEGTSYRALVLDAGLDALLAVDLQSGDRTVIADADTGSGPSFDNPQAVAIETDTELGEPTGRALVLDTGLAALLAVDLETGDRTVIADAGTGNGPALDEPVSMILETRRTVIEDEETEETSVAYVSSGRVLIADPGLEAIVAVDLATGTRNEIAGPDYGSGPPITVPQSLALDADDERALLVDEGLDALLMLDVRTGERVVVSR